jgi:ribosomal protein L29
MSNKNKYSILFHILPPDELSSKTQEELEEMTQQLRNELLELNYVESIESVETNQKIPEGVKGIEGSTVGSLLVNLVTSSGVIENITATLQSWLQNRGNQKAIVEINGDKIEITGLSSENQNKLVQAFIDKHK